MNRMILQMLSSPALSAFSASATRQMSDNRAAMAVSGFAPSSSDPSRSRPPNATFPRAVVRTPPEMEIPSPRGSLFDFRV
jgi:hypothetical protein